MENDMKTEKQKIKLDYPITTADGTEYTELSVRRVTVGDMRSVAHLKTDVEQEIAMVSRITGLVPEDIDLLDLTDYKKVQDTFRTA